MRNSKIIQICAVENNYQDAYVYALREDGKVFRLPINRSNEWIELPDIPDASSSYLEEFLSEKYEDL